MDSRCCGRLDKYAAIAPGLGEYQGRLLIQSLHSSRPCSSAASLVLKDRSLDTFDFYNRAEAAVREIVPCEYQSMPLQSWALLNHPFPTVSATKANGHY
jgi:hypothetical protein